MLERPAEVNRELRALAESVAAAPYQFIAARAATSAAARCPDRTAPSRKPVHWSAVSVPAQWIGPTGRRNHGP